MAGPPRKETFRIAPRRRALDARPLASNEARGLINQPGAVPWTRSIGKRRAFRRLSDHRLERGDPCPHARQERPASSSSRPRTADRNEKAQSVVASSRVPRLAGFAGSPPAAGSYLVVNRP